MIEMIVQGMKRRKKEIRYVSVVTWIAVLFMTGITLFQNIMNHYVFSNNLNNYGDWVISTVDRRCEHPYLQTESWCKTGVSLVDEDGKLNELLAGTVDENFEKVYASVLYEGRMPKTNDEIAIDVSALAILGYSYDLGQSVTLSYYAQDGRVEQKEYELVGILRNFSSMWLTDKSYELPNFLVTEQEFEAYQFLPETDINGKKIVSMRPNLYTTYFYQLDSEYEEINLLEFASSFILPDGEAERVQPVTYNRYVYENRVWGSPQMFENVTTAMMVIGALAIGYLLTAYIGKRRATYYRYRCIGASITQVRGIVAMECLYATIPAMILGMTLAYVLAIVSCELAKNIEYLFDMALFIKQITTAGVVVFLAIIFTQFMIRDKHLASNANVVKPRKYKKLRRQAKHTVCPEKKLFQRQRSLHPIQAIISGTLSIVVCACLVLCLFKMYDSIKHTLHIYETRIDFQMNYKDLEKYKYETPSKGYGNDMIHMDTYAPDNLALGVDEAFVEAVRTAPGVKNVKLYWEDEMHYFKWDGMEKSEILQYLKQKQEHHVAFEYDMRMNFYDTLENLKEKIKEEHMTLIETSEGFSWEKIEKGEQVILSIGTVYATYHDGEEEYLYLDDTTIKAGDTVYLKHILKDYEIPVEVGAVVYDNELLDQSYRIFACRPLAEHIVETEGNTLRYNRMEISYDNHSSYESTDKQLASLAVNHGMDYTSQAEERRTATNELVQNIGIYGVLFLLTLSVYIILQNSFLSSKRKYMQESYSILKRIGMEDVQYIRSAFLTEMKSFSWLYGGLLFGYLLIFCDRYMVNLTGGTAEEYVLEFAILETKNVEHWYFIAMVTLVYLVMLGNSAMVIRKSVHADVK